MSNVETMLGAAHNKSGLPTNHRFLRLRDVMARTRLARSTVYALVSAGKFPRQVSVGARSVVWVEAEVQDWMQGRIDESREGSPDQNEHGGNTGGRLR